MEETVQTGINPEEGQETVANTGENVSEVKPTETNNAVVDNTADKPFDYSSITLPEGYKNIEGFIDGFKENAEKYGFNGSDPKTNMEGFLNFINDLETKENIEKEQAIESMVKENEESLKKDSEFGKDYFGNMKIAVDAIQKFGGEELSKLFKENTLLGNPAIIKAFYNIGKQIQDAKLVTEKNNVVPNTPSTDMYGRIAFDWTKPFSEK